MKVTDWDNGLTEDQQADVDTKWEELKRLAKISDPELFKKIETESYEYFQSDTVIEKQNDNQLKLNL